MKMLGCASVSFEDWIFPVRSRPQGSLSSTWSVWRSCDCAQSVPAASRGRLLGTGQQYHKKKQHGHFKVIASRKKMQNSFNWQLWILPFLDSFGGCLEVCPGQWFLNIWIAWSWMLTLNPPGFPGFSEVFHPKIRARCRTLAAEHGKSVVQTMVIWCYLGCALMFLLNQLRDTCKW